MTVGLSHSGKTTLAKHIQENFSKPEKELYLIDTDTIRQMFVEHYKSIFKNTRDLPKPEDKNYRLTKPTIIGRVQQTMIDYLIEFHQNIILSNGNSYKDYRGKQIRHIQSHGYKIIMIRVNPKEEIILERLTNTTKDTKTLRLTTDFIESYQRQKKIFEIPTSDEADHFIEYDGLDMEKVIDSISPLIKKSTPE